MAGGHNIVDDTPSQQMDTEAIPSVVAWLTIRVLHLQFRQCTTTLYFFLHCLSGRAFVFCFLFLLSLLFSPSMIRAFVRTRSKAGDTHTRVLV